MMAIESKQIGRDAAGHSRPSIEYVGLRSDYVRRTAIANGVTLAVVSMTTIVYWNQWAWAGRYVASGIWAMAFFGLISPIFKALLFERRLGRGLLLIGAKIALLCAMIWLCGYWAKGEDGSLSVATSVLGGVLTLQVVVVLRAVGAAMQQGRRDGRTATGPTTPPERK